MSRINTNGKSTDAAISPDGRYVVYVIDDLGKRSLHVRQIQVAKSGDVEIVPPSEAFYSGLIFSSNGDYLYYLRKEANSPWFFLHRVPVLVGTSQSWITYQLWYLSYPAGHAQQISIDLNDYGRVSLTGDGKRLVTIQLNRLSNLWVAPTTNVSGAKQITVGSGTWARQLSWTPDGRIVYVIITNFQSDQIFSFAWSRDGKQLALARGTQTSSVVLIHNSE